MAVACSTAEPPVDPRADLGQGLTRAEELELQTNLHELIQECMEATGWEYALPDIEAGFVTPDERRAYGITQSLKEGAQGINSGAGTPTLEMIPPEQLDRYLAQFEECQDAAWSDREARLSSVEAEMAIFEQAWVEFRASPEWIDAEKAWSECMAEHRFDFADQQSALHHIGDQAQALLEAAGMDPRNLDLVAIDALGAEEESIFAADRACATDTIDAAELEFKTELYTEHAEELTAIRRAYLDRQ